MTIDWLEDAVQRVTLKTIAERAGVSRMTVSNAFSRPELLTDQLLSRVLAVADELGYVGPDPAARALARGTTGAVGLLLTDSLSEAFGDAVATTFLASVAESLTASGLSLTLLTPGGGPHGVVPARDVAVDGVLVYVCATDSSDVAWAKRRRLPMVGIDREPVEGFAHVNVDDRGGARAAAEHLVDLGHRQVGIMALRKDASPGILDDPLDARLVYSAQQRLLGWHDALSAAGITPTVVGAPFEEGAAHDAATMLLRAAERPTAILCYADLFARATVRAARQLGLGVPDDVSVVGFDDSPLALDVDPPITTVRQDIAVKGTTAVAALTAQLAARRGGTPAPAPEHVVLPTELVVRASTAPPGARA
jgi:DNA-binding LacI/PurR family transcriptional regulator